MTRIPLERAPDPALEDRVVAALVARGLLSRRRLRPWIPAAAAVAAALIVAAGVAYWRTRNAAAPADTYVLLLNEDSTYRPAPPGGDSERVTVVARWADSLAKLGKLEVGGRLVNSELPGGLFIIRAASDSDAARIAATCPFVKWGGHIYVRRFIE